MHIELEGCAVVSDSDGGQILSVWHILHDPFVLFALVVFLSFTFLVMATGPPEFNIAT